MQTFPGAGQEWPGLWMTLSQRQAVLQGSKNISAVLSCQVFRLLRGRAAAGSAPPEGHWTACTVSAEVSRGNVQDMAVASHSVTALCRL